MAALRVAALALALLAAGCAFRRGDPLPADPPADFALSIVASGSDAWPWDGSVRLARGESLAWDVAFRTPPSSRRGWEPLDPAVNAGAWAACVAAGFFDREPVPRALATGPVVLEGRALGLDACWSGDPATDEPLASLLAALRAALPARLFRPLPAMDEPR